MPETADRDAFAGQPNELLIKVFEYLDYRSMIKASRSCRHFHEVFQANRDRIVGQQKYRSIKIIDEDKGHLKMIVLGAKKCVTWLIHPDDRQRNAIPKSQVLYLNGEAINEEYLVSENTETELTTRVYSSNQWGSVVYRLKKCFFSQVDRLSMENIDLDEILSRIFPRYSQEEPVFGDIPVISYFELKDSRFASKTIYWEWNDVLTYFSPRTSFILNRVSMDCNGRSDREIKRNLLKNLQKRGIPRVHLKYLTFDYETNDGEERLDFQIPIEYCERKVFMTRGERVIEELEKWRLGNREIEHWEIDVNSEFEWRMLRQWIMDKALDHKKTRGGHVVTGCLKNFADKWLHLKAKGGIFIAQKDAF